MLGWVPEKSKGVTQGRNEGEFVREPSPSPGTSRLRADAVLSAGERRAIDILAKSGATFEFPVARGAERLDVLEARIKEVGLHPQDYWWYLDLRRYGSVPHAGFGLGFERMVQFAGGMQNIRDVIPYPSTPGSVDF